MLPLYLVLFLYYVPLVVKIVFDVNVIGDVVDVHFVVVVNIAETLFPDFADAVPVEIPVVLSVAACDDFLAKWPWVYHH